MLSSQFILRSDAVVGKMASQRLLPDSLVSLCLDILRTLSTSEKDLIRIVVEIIHELRDSDDEKDDDLMVCIRSVSGDGLLNRIRIREMTILSMTWTRRLCPSGPPDPPGLQMAFRLTKSEEQTKLIFAACPCALVC